MRYNSFDPSRRRLWVHGPKAEFEKDEDVYDQWYLAGRTLPLVRPGRDVIILPGGSPELRDFADFCVTTIGLDHRQILWTSGSSYLLDNDIRLELLTVVENILEKGNWELIPYAVTPEFLSWAEWLGIPTFGDDEQWVTRFSDKRILHPNASNHSEAKTLDTLCEGLRLPRGFACIDGAELLRARELLTARGVHGLILKPANATTGEGIRVGISEEELRSYAFPMGPVVLEERLAIDVDLEGRPIVPSVQYLGGLLCEGVTDQLLDGQAHVGNIMPSRTPEEFQLELLAMSRSILGVLKPRGPGGFDFLSVGGHPVLVDPNAGRFTACHPARLFRETYAPGSALQCWKFVPRSNIRRFWERLMKSGFAFQPGSSRAGVFPLCYLEGQWGYLAALGETREDVIRLRARAEELY